MNYATRLDSAFLHVITLLIGVSLLTRVLELIPSSARSTASSASPIPTQLLPLLEEALEATKKVLDRALPLGKKRTALEEAEWEDEGDEGALDREIMMQCKLCCGSTCDGSHLWKMQLWRRCECIALA